MKWWPFFFMIVIPYGPYGAVSTATLDQKSPEIRKLFREFTDPKTTNAATKQILQIATKDRQARDYFVHKLPAIIRDHPTDGVWLNSVRLAGNLKASEAVPPLMQALSRGSIGQGSVSFGEYMRLDTDLAAKALAEIGDPSVPEVAKLLTSPDRRVRQRAVLILRNISSPRSREVLNEHLSHETDPQIKDLIEAGLRS